MKRSTQVGIVGAGPAGLFLAEFLRQAGIDAVIVEARDREYVQQRVRAGVLEQGTVDAMQQLGVDARLRREGLVHEGFELLFDGARHRIDMQQLCRRARSPCTASRRSSRTSSTGGWRSAARCSSTAPTSRCTAWTPTRRRSPTPTTASPTS